MAQAERGERRPEIVSAIVVVADMAELLIAIAVAPGDQRVVHPPGRISNIVSIGCAGYCAACRRDGG